MGKLTVSDVKVLLVQAMLDSEWGDVRPLLDEHMPAPLWSEQVCMIVFLNKSLDGVVFSYDTTDGWSYEEEGA